MRSTPWPKLTFLTVTVAPSPGVVAGDHGSFKGLQTFFVALLDLDVDADGVARAEFRHRAEVFGDDFGQ
jgi:hypothetical protein